MINELTREGWPLSMYGDGRRHPFIVIEGGDGAGTTTQANLLVDRLNRMSYPAGATAEPTHGPIGQLIREMLGGKFGKITWGAQMHLFQADRAVHVAEQIWPTLTKDTGGAVVCDRYAYSTAVYQGIGAARDEIEGTSNHVIVDEWVSAVMSSLTEEGSWLPPDIAILLDVDDQIAADRRAARSSHVEIFDDAAFQREVLHQYRQLWHRMSCDSFTGKRFHTVNGNEPPEIVAENIWSKVKDLLQ